VSGRSSPRVSESRELPPDFAALDANLVESLREATRWQRGARLYEGDGLLIAHGSTNFPVGLSNAAARLDPAVPAAEVLARARAHFEGEGRLFTLWVRGAPDADLEAAAESAKLLPVSPVPSPWMVLRKRLPDPAPPRGVRVELVRDESQIRDVVVVSQAAWAPAGLPPAETASLLSRADRMLAPHLVWSLAWQDGRPAACAMALCSHGVAGIYWVGTVPDARRRGLAEIATRAAGNAGFDRGMRVAALQASAMGYPVYQRMGYETVASTRWYLARPTRR